MVSYQIDSLEKRESSAFGKSQLTPFGRGVGL